MNEEELARSRQDIAVGSKSFSLASFFFGREQRLGAWQLYSWCRYCDDQTDSAGEGVRVRVNELLRLTNAVYTDVEMTEHPWRGFQDFVRRFQVPRQYPLDLIRGMQWDAEGARIQTEAQLIDYCYCVAGTVGLMMCHAMGVSRNSALDDAVGLGIALQLTNISRDVREDFQRGRIYFPEKWLKDEGLERGQLIEASSRHHLQRLTDRLLDLADHYYTRGLAGLDALAWRSAWAVAAAAFIYRDIGHRVRSGGPDVFDRRVVISGPRKIWLAFKASLFLLKTLPGRLARPWRPVLLTQNWEKS